MLRTVTATEYLVPLREGGSLPAVMRADDCQTYVIKFHGAGQGPKALVAELLGGEIARRLGFRMPELVLMELDPVIGRAEPDAEIQDLLQASAGLNLAMTFIEQAAAFNLVSMPDVGGRFASDLVWFDAFISNVDRTPRNVNMLVSENEIWLIDHGASLYFHHNWGNPIQQAESKFMPVRDHVLLPLADDLTGADERLKSRLDDTVLEEIIGAIPDRWLALDDKFDSASANRQAYVEYFQHRLKMSHIFVEEAARARSYLL